MAEERDVISPEELCGWEGCSAKARTELGLCWKHHIIVPFFMLTWLLGPRKH